MDLDTIIQSNQTSSPLLRLPPEIRQRIYHFVLLYDGVVYIYPAGNGVDFCTENHTVYGCNHVVHRRPKDWRLDIRLRSTCRQIDHEVNDLYFTTNTFGFLHSIHVGAIELFEDRHFEVLGINQIKTLCLRVDTCAVVNCGSELRFDRFLRGRIDDLKGLKGLSVIHLQVIDCCDHLPKVDIAQAPFSFVPLNPKVEAEVVMSMIVDEFRNVGSGKSITCLPQ